MSDQEPKSNAMKKQEEDQKKIIRTFHEGEKENPAEGDRAGEQGSPGNNPGNAGGNGHTSNATPD
ncbi:hypothetical protein [Deinococcus roseus]|uniref:Uncharacterized protein n=1 Tax=Deinococcus roseus TaxID=392414 RepID=A0ABQ2D263_9DEIO|nr:hypothetical protein [Deinococcus roseus]GGJ39372.1 hypothetical protein GCM10008938_26810 [Deinococcus roseus]